MTARERLPNRRASESFNFECAGLMSGHTADAYRLAIHHRWHQDVDDRVAPPDRSGHWVCIDRWRDWTCWRRVTLERAP
jgi:hypothetical protein